MDITVKHSKTSTVADAGDTTLVQPSDWNADHTLTGTVPVANGGTGASTANDGLNALLPSQTANSVKVLTTDGTNATWSTNGSGTVTSVAATVPSFLSVSGSPITTSGTLVLTYSGTALPVANGGTGVTASSGANSVVLRDANVNINANALDDGYSNIAASGTPIVLTTASVRRFTITGSGGQTIKLPDATTLTSGAIFQFDNNQSSGAITVNNNSNTLIVSVPSGGFVLVNLLSNATAAGSWDRHDQAPSNVSWSTNTLDYAGSFTSGTWNGNAVAYNRGGTGQSSAFTAGGIVYGSTTSALAVTSIGTTGQVLTSAGAGTPTWTTPTTGTVTSVTGTSPVVSSGGNTPAISMPAATTSVDGYLTSTDWNTFNGKGSGTVTSVAALTLGTTGTDLSSSVATGTTTPVITLNVPTASATNRGALSASDWTTFNNKGSGTVTSVTATSPVASSGGATPAISLSANYGDTLNPYASKTANYFLAAPNGSAGAPTFRAIVAADIPTLNQNTTGSAGSVANALTIGTGLSGTSYNGSAAVTIANSGVTSNVAGTGVTVSGATGAVTISIGQAVATSSNVQFNSLGVGTAGSATAGEIRATNNITGYYSSDIKFKENVRQIDNAVEKAISIGGKYFDWTDECIASKGGADGYFVRKNDIGVIAQDVQAVLPEAVRTREDGSLAVDYQKLVSLAFAAIAELKAEINTLKGS
jgi:hypothetical protein